MTATAAPKRSWWGEWELALLVVFVLGVYATRLTTLPLRGEESRRARVAIEMKERGDWIVPRQQGEPFLSRPPLGSWVIAAAAAALGKCSPLAVRLPTLLATLATTILLYGYSRVFLSRAGALATGLIYATFGAVLQLGRLAETEATFTVFLAGALLVWHWGYLRGWPQPWPWVAGYVLAALAALTKGPQAPVYFAAGVSAYLILRRDWRTLLSGSHLIGLFMFTLIVGSWQIPCMLRLDTTSIWAIWSSDVTSRLGDGGIGAAFARGITFNSAVFASLLPWSFLLLDYCRPSLRQSLGDARAAVVFWGTCVVVTLPTCWIVRDGAIRYYMPMFPGIAVLVGVVVDRALAAEPGSVGRWLWGRFLWTMAATAVVLALLIAAAGRVKSPLPVELTQSVPFAMLYGVSLLLAVALMLRARRAAGPGQGRWGVFAVALVLGLTYNGPLVTLLARESEDTRAAVARVKAQLPPGTRLVSFGPVHHLFAYYYEDPIELRPLSNEGIMLADDQPYFVIGRCDDPYRPLPLPYAWETLSVVSCERNKREKPLHVVVVGRGLHLNEFAARMRAVLAR
jgi:4-amino-4-deoxy-L-arabinose transferase-like glycosyltransferase